MSSQSIMDCNSFSATIALYDRSVTLSIRCLHSYDVRIRRAAGRSSSSVYARTTAILRLQRQPGEKTLRIIRNQITTKLAEDLRRNELTELDLCTGWW